ncbi:MAG: hypothetical protein WBQ91_10780, partial [Candidatus Acidiferrum sp.]
VETKLTPRTGEKQAVFHSTTVTAFNRQPDRSWKVGPVLGVLDSPLPGAKDLLVKAMIAEYRIVAAGSQFTALDATGSVAAGYIGITERGCRNKCRLHP